MRLYLTGIPYSATRDEVLEFCAERGVPVTSIDMIYFPDSGKFAGYAFLQVDPSADIDLDSAISRLHNQRLGGREVVCRTARPRQKVGT